VADSEPGGAYRKIMKLGSLDWKLINRLAPYIRRHIWLFILSLVLMLSTDILSILHPYLVKIGIDDYIKAGDFSGLLRIGLYLGLVFIGIFLTELFTNYSVQYLGQKFLFDMRMDVFSKVLKLNSGYFDKTSTGSIMTNITNDVEAIREFISDGIVTILGDLLKLVFILGAMLFINYKLALITFITFTLFVIVTLIFRRNIRNGYRGVRSANYKINSALVETITGIKEITLFLHKDQSRKKFTGHNNSYLRSFLKVINNFAVFFAAFEVISFSGFIIILLFAHYTIGIDVKVGEIFAFFTYLNMFYRPLRQLAEKSNAFQSAMAASERIFTLMDTEIPIADPEGPAAGQSAPRGEIQFDRVTFAYEEGHPVIRDLSFSVASGEKVAIVGHTGAGKSTIINLINRFYDIEQGAVFVDGQNIKEYTLSDLRDRITTVPQDFFLFGGTIAENITLHRESVSPDSVKKAAEAVNADHFINQLAGGYDSEILENGKSLSTGQKQLLSFARAFVTDPRIIIIDEATSNIDSGTEKLIEEAVNILMKDRTALIIAHRLSTIKNADRILVIHKGRLVEEGTHETLLQKDGIYSQLYRMQTLKGISP